MKTFDQVPQALLFPGLLTAILEPSKLLWQTFREGVHICRLQGDPSHAPAAALLRYAPGAMVPQHTHQGWEYILVLSGAQEDDDGTHTAGTLKINPPGSSHTVRSPTGCIVLAVWERTVRFAAAEGS